MRKVPALRVPASIIDEAKRFRAQPEFTEAVRVNADLLLPLYEGQPLLNKLVNEEARWMVGGFAMHLHFTRDANDPTSGATLVRIQELCAAHGLASRGRVAALVALMRLSGHLAQTTSSADRRIKLLTPTDKMLAYAKPWLVAHLEPVRVLDPSADFRDLVATDPDFLGRFYREAGIMFLAGGRVLECTPDIRLFMSRDAGYMILLRMWVSDPNGAIPPAVPLSISYEEIGKRFGVSRAHVRKLMEMAEAHGFMKLHAEGGRSIELLPPLAALFNESLSLQLASIAYCCRRAAAFAD